MSSKHFYLYIDESGSRLPDNTDTQRRNGMNCFALGGFLVEETDKAILESKYLSFCDKWGIKYPLHSTKIRGKRDDFSWLNRDSKTNERFLEDLEGLLIDIPVIGFATVIDRDGYNVRYKEKYGQDRWLMCKTAFCILVERVTKYVKSVGGTFEIRFERCGPKEDNAIIAYAKSLKISGMPFSTDSSYVYNSLQKEDFKNTMLGIPKGKTKNNLFIQFADLYLYPMIKRKYDPAYRPWNVLFHKRKVIDSILSDEDIPLFGIKYSCFDDKTKYPD